MKAVYPHCQAQALPSGWLHFTVAASGVGQWLQSINDALTETVVAANYRQNWAATHPPAGRPRETSSAAVVFSIQHAHARCCSLLRLAHQEKLIGLQDPKTNASLSHWRIIQPAQLPWLNGAGKICFCNPSAWRLLDQLVEAVDVWEQVYSGHRSLCLLAQAVDLSEAFQGFHRHCRIWGEDRIRDPNLIQVRLGLIRATQAMLYLFLTYGLEQSAPVYL
ncbi:MAG: DALR anticodon-binding domain-containing protein [Leptolyngbyaceae cyanobacterium MO_188.B28]|nr:DALR anticodon-binding domain-containing protein [Leptolyngbyaceae cyanobacterium MO_188.B28]